MPDNVIQLQQAPCPHLIAAADEETSCLLNRDQLAGCELDGANR
jgi:hypothetical protein